MTPPTKRPGSALTAPLPSGAPTAPNNQSHRPAIRPAHRFLRRGGAAALSVLALSVLAVVGATAGAAQPARAEAASAAMTLTQRGSAPAGSAPARFEAVASGLAFADVSPFHPFAPQIGWLAARGISNGWGLPNGTRAYRPDLAIARDAMAAFLYRSAGSPAYTPPATSPFADVRPGSQFYREICWLYARGISTGWTAGSQRSYRPGDTITRDAMAAFLYRSAGSPAYTPPATSPFVDERPGRAFYKEVTWLAARRITTGWLRADGRREFRPQDSVRRDAMAAFLFRRAGLSTPTIGAVAGCAGLCVSPARWYEDHGSLVIRGAIAAPTTPSAVTLSSTLPGAVVAARASLPVAADGTFAWSTPVLGLGTYGYAVSLGTGPTLAAGQVPVANATVSLDVTGEPAYLSVPYRVTGAIAPGLAGRTVTVSARRSDGTWLPVATGATGAGGRFAFTVAYGSATVGTTTLRAAYVVPNRVRTEYSATLAVSRTSGPALAATTHPTVRSEVSLSYRAGCPVGPSQLTTIDMNHWGFDGTIHRGRLIVRTDVAARVIASFQAAFAARFPFRVMQDPSAYGNDDRVSMAADNTYAFSCRPVTGNPGVVSPHSYGRAIDVDPVENPYREPGGTWSPANGRPYVDRSVRRPGMLFADSALTRSLTARGFQWYVGWDYQHFQG